MKVHVQGLSKEESKVDPWTLLARYHLKAEQEFKGIEGYVTV